MSGRPPALPPAIGERPFKCAVDGCDNPPGISGMCADHLGLAAGEPAGQPLRRFELPLCPSANVYYRHRNNPNPRLPPITYVSPEGRDYQKRVAQIILPQRLPRLHGKLEVRVAIWFERETGDTDNRIKPLLDALEAAEVFAAPPPKKKGAKRQAIHGDRQIVLVEAYRAGISPLVVISEWGRDILRAAALKEWKRQAKTKPNLKRPGEPRKKRRYGVMLVEIDRYEWPDMTVEDFKAEAGWDS